MQDLKQMVNSVVLPEKWTLEIDHGVVFFYYEGKILLSKDIPKSILNSNVVDQRLFRKFEKFIQSQVKRFPEELYKHKRGEYYVGCYQPGIESKPPTHESFVDLNTVLPKGFEWKVEDNLTTSLVMYRDGEKLYSHGIFASTLDRLAGLGNVATETTPRMIIRTAQYMAKNLNKHLAEAKAEQEKKQRINAWNVSD